MCGGGVRRNAPLLGRNEVLFANTLASPSNGSEATVKVFLFFLIYLPASYFIRNTEEMEYLFRCFWLDWFHVL